MTAQNYTNFSGNPGSNQPTSYVSGDGFVGPPASAFNTNSPTFGVATFPSGVTLPGGSTGTTAQVTAHSGGGRSAAVAISAAITNLATVAATGDSVVLPAAVVGASYTIVNLGASGAQVFANGSDTIDSVAGATGILQMPGRAVTYTCPAAATWTRSNAGLAASTSLALAVTAVTNTDLTMSIPNGAILTGIIFYTTTAFTGNTGSVTAAVGSASAGAQFVAAVRIDAIGVINATLVNAAAASYLNMSGTYPNLFVRIAQAASSTAVGAGTMVVQYILP